MEHRLIRPGLLISLKTAVRGGVRYEKLELEAERKEGAASVARWETRREITDADEHKAGIVARGKARTAITRVCMQSTFGLLCPTVREEALADGIAEAQAIAEKFNASAKTTRLEVLCLTGRIADSDVEAAKAISAEMRDLLGAIEAGIRAADPEAIRDAANRARAVSGMLTEEAQGKVSKAVAEARAIAKDIILRVSKSGETAASVVQDLKLEALQSARFAVLDIDGGEAPAPSIAAPAAPGIDLVPIDAAPAAMPVAPVPQLDLGA